MDLSIIIPTYNEGANILTITERIQTVIPSDISYEIFFIDDSSDDTPVLLQGLAARCSKVKYLHRLNAKGLASAVVEGLRSSLGNFIIVMDADLQHPPEVIPLILKRLEQSEVVIPSRFISGGSDGGLNWKRKLISWAARKLASCMINRLSDISDCTSGYFGIRRTVIEHVQLEPIGWKIMMEILVKGKYKSVHEVPYSFNIRNLGSSKMCIKEQFNYLKHITRLIQTSTEDLRFITFCTVGAWGVFVNILILRFLFGVLAIEGVTASFLASALAMVHNYILNCAVTWRDRAASGYSSKQFGQYSLISLLGILVTVFFARAFLSLGWNIYVGQLIGIVISTYWTFNAHNRWTWFKAQDMPQVSRLTVTQEYPTRESR